MHTAVHSSVVMKKTFGCLITVLIVYLLCPLSLPAETILSDSIADTTFTASGNPYIIEKTLIIPKDRNVVIGEGCRFFFKLYSGIIIEGSLKVTGTPAQPVMFSSINDSLFMQPPKQLPNPFDWNGIHIKSDAGLVELSNFILSYSVYGIKSQKATFTIVNGTFRKNGQAHCTVNDVPKPIADDIPFTYVTHGVIYDRNGASSGEVPLDTRRYSQGMKVDVPKNSGNLARPDQLFTCWNSSPDGTGNDYAAGSAFIMGEYDVHLYAKWMSAGKVDKTPKPQRPKLHGDGISGKKKLSFILGGAGIICGGVSVFSLTQWFDQKTDFDATTDLKKQEQLNDDAQISSAISIATGSLSVAAIAAGVVLYASRHSLNDKVAVLPVIFHRGAGATVTINLYQ
jgi:hypothetical protein